MTAKHFTQKVKILLIIGLLSSSIVSKAQYTVQVKNINEVTQADYPLADYYHTGSYPRSFVIYKGILYFSATDGHDVNGRELWKHDGTTTEMALDIYSGTQSSPVGWANNSDPNNLIVFQDTLFFFATDSNGTELRKFDGTNISLADSNNLFSSYNVANMAGSGYIFEHNNGLYFGRSDHYMWRYKNGVISQIVNNIGLHTVPVLYNNEFYFAGNDGVHGLELWRTDGDSAVLAADIKVGNDVGGNPIGSYPTSLKVYNNNLYFSAVYSDKGFELVKYNGDSVSLVADINPTGSSNPRDLVVFNNSLFFSANSSGSGNTSWKYNDTILSQVGIIRGFSTLPLTNLNGALCGLGRDSSSNLIIGKYTASGIQEYSISPPITGVKVFLIGKRDGKLYFVGNTQSGQGYYQFDGDSVTLAADIIPGFYRNVAIWYDSTFYFGAHDGVDGWELWKAADCLPSFDTVEVSVCNQYVSPSGTHTFFSSGTYSDTLINNEGCDSIISIRLIVKDSSSSSHTQVACDSFTWINNITYFESTDSAIFVLSNSAGCDSVIRLDLTILNSSESNQVISSCQPLRWIDGQVYNQSNTSAVHIIQNSAGCDSLIYLNFTLNPMDLTVNVTSSKLTAISGYEKYQWLDCDDNYNPIPGEDSSTFESTTTGNYAVEIWQDDCSDTSICKSFQITNSISVFEDKKITIYPNPAYESIVIESQNVFESDIILYNSLGQKMIEIDAKGERSVFVPLDEYTQGLYFLEINGMTFRFTKE